MSATTLETRLANLLVEADSLAAVIKVARVEAERVLDDSDGDGSRSASAGVAWIRETLRQAAYRACSAASVAAPIPACAGAHAPDAADRAKSFLDESAACLGRAVREVADLASGDRAADFGRAAAERGDDRETVRAAYEFRCPRGEQALAAFDDRAAEIRGAR